MKNFNTTFNSKGLTLLEVIVSIFIFTMIGMAIWSFQKDIFSLNDFLSNDLTIQQESRKTFKQISEEIRSISPSSAGTYPILEATSTSFIFYSDINNDGLKEQIHYFLDKNTLKKGIIVPSGNPLVYNSANKIIKKVIQNVVIGDPIFEYYDASYDGTTPALSAPVNIISIRLIKINITADKDPNRPSSPFTMTTQISMRNLKDNL